MKTHQCALDNAAKNSALPIFCYKWVNLFFYSRHQISTAYLWLAKGVSHFNKWWPTSTLTFENKQMSLSTNEDTCIFLKVKLVRDSGPRLCYNIMDPNDCGHQCWSLKTKKCHCQEDTCIFLKVKLVRDSGPIGCDDTMDPNDCRNQSWKQKNAYLKEFYISTNDGCWRLKTSKCHCQLMRISAFVWNRNWYEKVDLGDVVV